MLFSYLFITINCRIESPHKPLISGNLRHKYRLGGERIESNHEKKFLQLFDESLKVSW